MVVLAGTDLLEFPLEMLPLLQRENICSVSRDFSLQMLHHRVSKNMRETSGENWGKKKKMGLVRESNPGPLAPEARIIPLDQQALQVIGSP